LTGTILFDNMKALQSVKENKQLKDYSAYHGNLRGNPYIGSIMYPGGSALQYELFLDSFTKMIQYNNKFVKGDIYYDTVRSNYLPAARNIMSRHAIGEWVMMIDTDIQFEPDAVSRMINIINSGRNIHVLTGVYLYKKPPFYPVIYTWNKDKKEYQIVKDWITKDHKLDLFEIGASGSGFLMIKKWVFGYIEQQLKEEPFAIRRPFDNAKGAMLGEDFSFFDRCRQLDIQVICDPTIHVNHIVPRPVEPGKDYEPHKIDPTI